MRVALLGDIALIGKFDLACNKNVYENLKEIAEYLAGFDYVIANLESSFASSTCKPTLFKSMHLRSNEINVNLLKFLNIKAVSLANNHIYDYGICGLDQTIEILKKNNIDYFGVNGKVIELNEIIISGFCCLSTNGNFYNNKQSVAGLNILDPVVVYGQAELDKAKKKVSLMSFHWGDEHTHYPKYEHIQFARKLTSMNNVIVHGHHPHVIQGIELIEKSLIAYSLGNFCFDDCHSIMKNGLSVKQLPENRQSFILELDISNGLVSHSTVGISEEDDQIIFSDINDSITDFSRSIENIQNPDAYLLQRKLQIYNSIFREKKFGKKNIHWYLSRLNRYAIAAFLYAKFNRYFYKRIFKI